MAEADTSDQHDNTRKVRPWIAALLSAFAGWGVGFFYAHQTKAALWWFWAQLGVTLIIVIAVFASIIVADGEVLRSLLSKGAFPLAPLILSIVSYLVVGAFAWRAAAKTPRVPKSSPVRLLGYGALILTPFLIALAVRGVVVQPFTMPSESMAPTLKPGDYFLVSKWPYGYSRFAAGPFAGVLPHGRIFAKPPQRGDVAVFKLNDNRTDYVKRIVGLPGDHVQVLAGALYLNGEAVRREALRDVSLVDEFGVARKVRRWKETLPNGISYETYDLMDNGGLDDTDVYRVPAGHYFMMGDNRDNSQDSRVLGVVGYVPFDQITGRLEIAPIPLN